MFVRSKDFISLLICVMALALAACTSSTTTTKPSKVYTAADYAAFAKDHPSPKHIAVLLPLSGPTAAPAQAVLNGFLAAYYASQNGATAPLPVIKIYDSTANVLQDYQQAILDGADFVVGPLTKANVQLLLEKADIKVPTLALNYSVKDQRPPSNFYQFALSPESDAQAIAQRANQQGYHHAITLTPEGQWGTNVVNAFNQQWQQDGGSIVAAMAFTIDDSLSDSISTLLNTDQSTARRDNLQWLLKEKIAFTPRRRQDVDMIFLNALPTQAQQVLPLLRFYYAGDLPIYATSQIYNGTPNPQHDKDLDGIQFPIMPWAIDPTPDAFALRQQLQHLWGVNFKQYSLLYAFGADAYTLTTHLAAFRHLAQYGLAGNTGVLYLGAHQHIERHLQWAKFENGIPVLITP